MALGLESSVNDDLLTTERRQWQINHYLGCDRAQADDACRWWKRKKKQFFSFFVPLRLNILLSQQCQIRQSAISPAWGS